MRLLNMIVWVLILAVAGWYGYNYAVTAPAALDKSLDEAALMLAASRPDGIASDAAKTCIKDEIKARLPSLYGWEVRYRLALRDAAMGALGNPPTDIYWSYAIDKDFAGSGKSTSEAMQELLGASLQKCQSVN